MAPSTIDEISAYLRYSVPPAFLDQALTLLTAVAHDPIGRGILGDFYKNLPDAREDGIRALRLLGKSQGIFLIAAQTFYEHCYLYLATPGDIRFVGPPDACPANQELFSFFSIIPPESNTAIDETIAAAPSYTPPMKDPDHCPVCFAATGEYHSFGCPVEVCPWCLGQLTDCGCRFEQLRLQQLKTCKECDNLLKLVQKKGRIPYAPQQRPGYPAKPT